MYGDDILTLRRLTQRAMEIVLSSGSDYFSALPHSRRREERRFDRAGVCCKANGVIRE